LQNLLAERFHMVVQRGTKEFQGYDLVVSKGGHKLKQSSPEDAAFDQSQPRPMIAPPPPPPPGPGGRMEPLKLDHPGMMMLGRMSSKGLLMHMTARAQTLEQLINTIAGQLNRPVVDGTELTGKYDFDLEFSADAPMGMGGMLPPPPPGGGINPPGGDSPEDIAPALPTALQQQLGLRLESKKITLPTITVEKADKTPTEN